MINDKEKRTSPPNKAKLDFKFIKHCEKKEGETQNANLQNERYRIQQTINKEYFKATIFLVHYLTLYSAGFFLCITLVYSLKKSYLLS